METSKQEAALQELRKNLTEELETVPDRSARNSLLGVLHSGVWVESSFSYYPLAFRLKYYRLWFLVYDHLRRRRQMTRRESPMDPDEVGPVLDLLNKMMGKK